MSAGGGNAGSWPCSGKIGLAATSNWYLDASAVGFLRILKGWTFDEEPPMDIFEGGVPCDRLLFDYSFAFWSRRINDDVDDERAREELKELRSRMKDEWKRARHDGRTAPADAEEILVRLVEEYQERLGKIRATADARGGNDRNNLVIFKSASELGGFLTNFEFDNPNLKKPAERIRKFVEYLKGEDRKVVEERALDKTLIKLLPSAEEFSNEFLGNLTVGDLMKHVSPLAHVFLISIEAGLVQVHAFQNDYVYFHSPDLSLSYRIQEAIANRQEAAGAGDSALIGSLADALEDLVKKEAQWTLENLLMVRLGSIRKQMVSRASYYPFDRCAAEILLSNDHALHDFMRRDICIGRSCARGNEGLWISGLSGLVEWRPLSIYSVEWLREQVAGGSGERREKPEFLLEKPEFLLSWAAADVTRARREGHDEGSADVTRARREGHDEGCGEIFKCQYRKFHEVYKNAENFARGAGEGELAGWILKLSYDVLRGDDNIFMNDTLRMIAGRDAAGRGELLKHLAQIDESMGDGETAGWEVKPKDATFQESMGDGETAPGSWITPALALPVLLGLYVVWASYGAGARQPGGKEAPAVSHNV